MSERSSVGHVVRLQSASSESDLKSVEMAGLDEDFRSGSGHMDDSYRSDDLVIE